MSIKVEQNPNSDRNQTRTHRSLDTAGGGEDEFGDLDGDLTDQGEAGYTNESLKDEMSEELCHLKHRAHRG